MVCKNCGATIPDGAAFCPNCGQKYEAPAEEPQPQTQYQDPYQQEYQPQYQPQQYQPVQPVNPQPQPVADVPKPLPIMILGIIAFALSWFGETVICAIVALILAIIAMKQYKTYLNLGGDPSGKAKLGKTFALIALIISIVWIGLIVLAVLFYVIVFVLILGGGAIAAMSNSGSRYAASLASFLMRFI